MVLSAIPQAKFPEVVTRRCERKEVLKWIEIAGELSGHGTVESQREHVCPGHDRAVLDTSRCDEVFSICSVLCKR